MPCPELRNTPDQVSNPGRKWKKWHGIPIFDWIQMSILLSFMYITTLVVQLVLSIYLVLYSNWLVYQYFAEFLSPSSIGCTFPHFGGKFPIWRQTCLSSHRPPPCSHPKGASEASTATNKIWKRMVKIQWKFNEDKSSLAKPWWNACNHHFPAEIRHDHPRRIQPCDAMKSWLFK